MRYLVILCLFCATLHGAPSPIQAGTEGLPPEPVASVEIEASLRAIDQLIGATERSLATQRKIRAQLVDYAQLKSQYLKDQHNRELMVRLVKAAYGLQSAMQSAYLDDALDSELVRELSFFSQIAGKKSLPKP